MSHQPQLKREAKIAPKLDVKPPEVINEEREGDPSTQRGFLVSCWAAVQDTATEIIDRPRLRFLGDYIFYQPALYLTLVITFTYLIGSFTGFYSSLIFLPKTRILWI